MSATAGRNARLGDEMTQPDEETIARVIREHVEIWVDVIPYDGVETSLAGVDQAASAILALFPDATRQAERIAELERALRDARDTIETLYSARGSECEGELSAWVGPIDAALASAQSSTTGASDD